jgi:ribosomal protein S18 acetylase RimI-like enzyme
VRVRTGVKGDLSELRRLWQELSAETARAPYGPSDFDEYWPTAAALLDHNLVVVAELDGRLLGCALAARTRSDIGHVFGLYVRPEGRRQGVGRTLLRAAATVLRERGARWILVDVDLGNDEALRFYERLGFEQTGLRLTIDAERL